MARGFTQYGAKQIVGRQVPMKLNEPKPPPVVPPISGIPTMWSPDFSADTAAAKQLAIAANSFVADDFTDEDEEDGNIFGDPKSSSGGLTQAQKLARQDAIAGAKGSENYLFNLLRDFNGETDEYGNPTSGPYAELYQRISGNKNELNKTITDQYNAALAGSAARYAPLLAQIATNKTDLEGTVGTNYDTALAALAGRVGAAKTETTTNYDALRDRLTAAAPRAYANLPAATAPALSQDAVSRYAQAIGAPTQAIGQAAVEAAAPYAGTADAYNRLIENLRANEASGQASRLAGVEMGRGATASQIDAQNLSSTNALDVQKNTALAQILQAIQGQQFGVSQQQLAYEQGLGTQRDAQLAQVLQAIQGQQMGVSQSELAYKQGLEQALAGIYGTGYVPPPQFIREEDFAGIDWNALGRLMKGRK